jgi:hypothetical protein
MIIFIIIIIIVLLSVGGGAFYYFDKKKKDTLKAQADAFAQAQADALAALADKTEWNCIEADGEYLPARVSSYNNKTSECMSWEGENCLWSPDRDTCDLLTDNVSTFGENIKPVSGISNGSGWPHAAQIHQYTETNTNDKPKFHVYSGIDVSGNDINSSDLDMTNRSKAIVVGLQKLNADKGDYLMIRETPQSGVGQYWTKYTPSDEATLKRQLQTYTDRPPTTYVKSSNTKMIEWLRNAGQEPSGFIY